MSIDVLQAENILKKFFLAMNEWELKFYPIINEKGLLSVKDVMKKEIDDIFLKFCTLKERKQGRQVSLSCSEPPEYSRDEEVLKVDLVKNKAYIFTQQHTGFKNQYKYTLHYKNHEWRIDKKEWLDEDDDGNEKWAQAYL